MPALENARHERFAQAIAKGSSQREAYIEAGYEVGPEVADAAASRLLSDVRVSGRVTELQERAAIRVEMTAADIVAMLKEDRDLARTEKQSSAAVSASMGIAKVLGLLVDKNEHSGVVGTVDLSEDIEAVTSFIGSLVKRADSANQQTLQ